MRPDVVRPLHGKTGRGELKSHLRTEVSKRVIGLSIVLALSFTLVSVDAEGQRSGKIPRLGVLSIGGGPPAVIDSFFEGLRDLGWVDGQNLIIERRNAEGREER